MNDSVRKRVYEAALEMAIRLPDDIRAALTAAIDRETGPGRGVLEMIRDNLQAADRTGLPMCQDTGLIVVWVEVGEERTLAGLRATIEQALADAVRDGRWRASVVAEPLRERANTGTNLPALFHWDIVPGRGLTIHLMAKGFGSENKSRLVMLSPTAGRQAVIDAVVETVCLAGGSSCPPEVVGVGIGGTSDHATWLAKRSLFRTLGQPHTDPFYAELERDLLKAVNDTGVGPGGFGGLVTALAVHVEASPTHIAGLPLAVNLNCWASRRATLHIEDPS
jgi:fumarate hydratase subunit alpha